MTSTVQSGTVSPVQSSLNYEEVVSQLPCQAWTHTGLFGEPQLAVWILGLDAHSKPNSLNGNLKWRIRLRLLGSHNVFIHQKQNQNIRICNILQHACRLPFVTCRVPHTASTTTLCPVLCILLNFKFDMFGGCQGCS